ncbi:MAG: helix-turn-helix domain-containing protein [Clostridiales bacterium]|nr:helix-turn-helix domain-containing protein [Clostridiales bacterium]
MAYQAKQFGIVLKNARMDKHLTQAELAEILDISLSYLKDLERFRNNPSYEIFEKVIRYFNLSADTVIYPNKNLNSDTYQQIDRLLTRCDESQLRVILATVEALLAESERNSETEAASVSDK